MSTVCIIGIVIPRFFVPSFGTPVLAGIVPSVTIIAARHGFMPIRIGMHRVHTPVINIHHVTKDIRNVHYRIKDHFAADHDIIYRITISRRKSTSTLVSRIFCHRARRKNLFLGWVSTSAYSRNDQIVIHTHRRNEGRRVAAIFAFYLAESTHTRTDTGSKTIVQNILLLGSVCGVFLVHIYTTAFFHSVEFPVRYSLRPAEPVHLTCILPVCPSYSRRHGFHSVIGSVSFTFSYIFGHVFLEVTCSN